MARQHLTWPTAPGSAVRAHSGSRHPVALAGSAFALGVVAGLFLKEAVQRVQERAIRYQSHRDVERTVTYDENLPDSLGRREPLPHAAEPRFGGTGALGVSPTAVVTPPGEPPTPPDTRRE
jgi:hypothetical protein